MICQHIDYKRDIANTTKKELETLTDKATQAIEAIVRQTMHDADIIANGLSSGKLSNSEALLQLKTILQNNPKYYGATIAYQPHGYDPGRRLYAPYYKKSGVDGQLEFVQIETSYDYTMAERKWYSIPIQKGKGWIEPYWGEASQILMVTYSSVFYDYDPANGSKRPLGVVAIPISIPRIKKIIEAIDLGPSGFGALLSSKGFYIYHPIKDYVDCLKHITQVAQEKNDNDRKVMAEMAAKGQKGFLDHVSVTTKQPSWLVVTPVAVTGWSLQSTFVKDDIQIKVDTIRHQLIRIVVIMLLGLLSFLAVVQVMTAVSKWRAWFFNGIGSLLIVAAIVSIWVINLTYNPVSESSGKRVYDKATLQKIKGKHLNLSNKKNHKPAIYVPTGVFIDSIKFSGPNDVLLSGYIWQKYNDDFPENIIKEFTISKALNIKINKLNSVSLRGEGIIRSYFEAEIRQTLNHGAFPLERERIELGIVHKNLATNVILTPDLDAYPIRSASLLPGLAKGAFISGWKLTNAYFELREMDLNTNFGVDQAIEGENVPFLCYNIGIQRNIIDALISNLTPVIIVSILLFFLLLLINKIDPAKTFSICVAMLFVIVFSHIDIRIKISAQEIFYLEYFYFLTYGAILYVLLNAIGTFLEADIWLFHSHTIIPQLLFWPVFLSLILLVTIVTFY
jgi:hypothetical protein